MYVPVPYVACMRAGGRVYCLIKKNTYFVFSHQSLITIKNYQEKCMYFS